MGLIKLGVVVFFAYTLGGKLGEMTLAAATSTPQAPDTVKGARWAGRAVAFVGFGYVAQKLL